MDLTRVEWAIFGAAIRRMLQGSDTTARLRVESNVEKAGSSLLAEERLYRSLLTPANAFL